MGRDDHNNKKNNFMALTPKQQLSDGLDIEFSEELADENDKKALARSKAADQRVKARKNL